MIRNTSFIPMPKTQLAQGKPPLAPAVHRPNIGAQWSHHGENMRSSSNMNMNLSNLKVTPDQRLKQGRIDSDESHGNGKMFMGGIMRSNRRQNDDNSPGGFNNSNQSSSHADMLLKSLLN